LEVVAEGVETTGQLGFLRLHGCEGFQGYLFGRPVPVDVFAREHDLGAAAGTQAASPAPQHPQPAPAAASLPKGPAA
ncbi:MULTISPECIES: EAL domain-containing protein, partial [unclassified Acidovorax]|uniref:EAL domain-containing protein n=1 Tax=unclassified Acidovorax TaxID=2684926 RepID=UPI000ACE5968